VKAITPDASIAELVRSLAEARVSGLPVVNTDGHDWRRHQVFAKVVTQRRLECEAPCRAPFAGCGRNANHGGTMSLDQDARSVPGAADQTSPGEANHAE